MHLHCTWFFRKRMEIQKLLHELIFLIIRFINRVAILKRLSSTLWRALRTMFIHSHLWIYAMLSSCRQRQCQNVFLHRHNGSVELAQRFEPTQRHRYEMNLTYCSQYTWIIRATTTGVFAVFEYCWSFLVYCYHERNIFFLYMLATPIFGAEYGTSFNTRETFNNTQKRLCIVRCVLCIVCDVRLYESIHDGARTIQMYQIHSKSVW